MPGSAAVTRGPGPALLRCAFPEQRRSLIRMLGWVQMASARSSNAVRSLWWLGTSERCRNDRGADSARRRDRRRGSALTMTLQSAHRPQPGLWPPVVCFDPVVRVLLDCVQA